MADSPIDYALVLVDLKEKRDRLDAAIAGIETMLGLQSSPTNPNVVAPSNGGQDLGPGAFLGMKIVEAAAKLLSVKRRALRTEEILTELRSGGMAFSSDNPINTVGSVLNRDFKQGGEIVSVGRGQWALAEWHPRLRRRKPQNGGAVGEDVVGGGVVGGLGTPTDDDAGEGVNSSESSTIEP